MPNHVRNVLQLHGEQKDIDSLLGHVRSEESAFDFNTLIPMPKTLDIVSGSQTVLGLEAAKYLETGVVPEASNLQYWRNQEDASIPLERYIDILVEQGRCNLNLGQVALDNIREHGSPTWYEWRCAHWGTKWNAYSIEITENTISFDTAWAAPEAVIDKLAELFPAVQITHYWSDENIGSNCGHTVYWDGGKTPDIVIDHSSDAYETYVFCWGDSDCLERDERDDWQRKDCEVCAGCD